MLFGVASLLFPILLPASTEVLSYQVQILVYRGKSLSVRVPAGYQLELLTDKLNKPRLPTFAANGDLFVGSRSGEVYRLTPPYNRPRTLINLDNYPHSIAFRQGRILIAQTDGVYQAPYQPEQPRLSHDNLTLMAALPGGGGHNSRTVAVGPDGKVYVSLGISGNCSDQYLGEPYPFYDRRGGVLVLDETGTEPQWRSYGSGLRNPVGFAWHPQTKVMYASNNGPDHLGYDQPPEYFSRIDPGSFHGMPWYQFDGKQLVWDSCIFTRPPRPIRDVTLPVVTFPARNAPLGVAFVPKGAMDTQLEMDAVVALHGSWGTKPGGRYLGDASTRRHPKIVAVRFDGEKAVRVDDLVTGFQSADGDRWARPAGVAVGPDGALYFTSDSGINGLFRLRRTGGVIKPK